jgi:hypothetical protein
MSNEQLEQEANHRFATFGETLGGYETGGIEVTYNGHQYWVDDVTDQTGAIALVKEFEAPSKIIRVKKASDQYRSLLLQILTARYQIANNSSYPEESVDQATQLANIRCMICQDLHFLNKEPISDHLEIIEDKDTRSAEQWAQEMFDLCLRFQDKEVQIDQMEKYVKIALEFNNDKSINWKSRSEALSKKIEQFRLGE